MHGFKIHKTIVLGLNWLGSHAYHKRRRYILYLEQNVYIFTLQYNLHFNFLPLDNKNYGIACTQLEHVMLTPAWNATATSQDQLFPSSLRKQQLQPYGWVTS